MSCSVAGSKVGGRKFNIDDKFRNSPYLSKPLGSPQKSIKSKSKTRRRRGDEDSVASFRTTRTQRTSQTSYRGSSHLQQSSKRHPSTKNLLLPREMDKLLRGFRQKNSNHAVLRGQPDERPQEKFDNDDNSTIASDFADSMIDKDVYLHIRQDKTVNDILFSGPLFAELAIKKQDTSPILNCPPEVVLPQVNVGLDDMSDMESVNDNNRNKISRRKR